MARHSLPGLSGRRARRCAQETELGRLQRELAATHLKLTQLARERDREAIRADVAEQALADFRLGIRQAHSALAASNADLRRQLRIAETGRTVAAA